MRKMFLLAASVLVLAVAVSAAYATDPVRVDVNGELVNELTQWQPGGSPNAPYFWEKYSEGAGGGYSATFESGGSSNLYGMQYENESDYNQDQTYPTVHSLLLGASAGIGRYGIKQTYSGATAGKLYWFTGGQRYNTADGALPNRPYFDYGIENGTGIDNGTLQSGNLKTSTFNGKNNFMSTVIATGSELTYHVGHKETNKANAINSYFDGFRVWEFDISAKQGLVNGDFNSTNNLNATGYRVKGGTTYEDQIIPEGWTPFGSGAGQVNRYIVPTDGTRGNVFCLDQYKGQGRMFAFQKVNMGAGYYNLTADLATWGLTEGDARVGIDFSGGTDPNAASVTWTSALTVASTDANHVYQNRRLYGQGGANGITIWLASGWAGAARSGASGQSYFDNLNLSYMTTPEPSSMLALASGLIGMAGFVVRRRK